MSEHEVRTIHQHSQVVRREAATAHWLDAMSHKHEMVHDWKARQ